MRVHAHALACRWDRVEAERQTHQWLVDALAGALATNGGQLLSALAEVSRRIDDECPLAPKRRTLPLAS